jgi:teichuronic acid exporter
LNNLNQNHKDKAVKGVSWSLIDTFANFGISFLFGIVLARILSPKEFGLVGMITIFISLSFTLVDSGFSSALIWKGNVKNIDYNTVFYLNLVLSILLYTLLYFSAPSISFLFSEPILTPLTRAIGFVIIINALGIVQRTILTKAIDFKTQTKISLISSIASGIIGIVMAKIGYGVWSLVIMQVTRQFLSTSFLWIFNSWRPMLEFSKESFKDLFGFGSKLLVSSVINSLYENIYYVIIGKYYTFVHLGHYARAQQFNTLISSSLTTVVQRVSFPVLSNLNTENNDQKLKLAYSRIIKSTMLLTFLLVLCLAAIAEPLIVLLIGIKWLPAVVYLQILCLGSMLYPLHAINLNMLMVKGRSDLFLKLEIVKKVIGIFPILIGIFYGIKLMLLFSVVGSFISLFLNAAYSKKLINYSINSQIKDVFPSFFVAFFVAFSMWSIIFLDFNYVITLSIQLFIGGILSFIILENLKFSEYKELKEIFKSFIIRKTIKHD